jgi:ribonuclease VapC
MVIDRHSFNEAIAAASQWSLSAASLVELSIVIGARSGSDGQAELVASAASSTRL